MRVEDPDLSPSPVESLLTWAFCPTKSIGHQQHSGGAPDSGLPSSAPSSSGPLSCIFATVSLRLVFLDLPFFPFPTASLA